MRAHAHTSASLGSAHARPAIISRPLPRPRADDFDLPATDLDDDTDETRAVPKRKDDEKWNELCLDELNSTRGRLPTNGGLH